MSKIIETVEDRELGHIIQADNGQYYYVDSCETMDQGYETMTFEYDIEKGEVSSWSETYGEHYDSYEEMVEGHQKICENYEEYGYDIERDDDDVAGEDIDVSEDPFGDDYPDDIDDDGDSLYDV